MSNKGYPWLGDGPFMMLFERAYMEGFRRSEIEDTYKVYGFNMPARMRDGHKTLSPETLPVPAEAYFDWLRPNA
jgi:hypothetical protein